MQKRGKFRIRLFLLLVVFAVVNHEYLLATFSACESL